MMKQQSIADPGPLGLAAFAATTLVLSAVNAGLVPHEIKGVFLMLALFYGGFTQLLAGMWEFVKNNTFGATAFTTYGAFWLSLGSMDLLIEMGILNFGAHTGTAIGLFLVPFAIITFYLWIGTFAQNKALQTVFTTLLITFILLIFAEFGVIDSKFGGFMGIITAFCAFYTSAAGIINSTHGRTVLSVGESKGKVESKKAA